MTLVVGRKENDRVYIFADSRIDDPERVRGGPLVAQLKSVIINPFLCVCFAGVVHFAREALTSLLTKNDVGAAEALQTIEEVHAKSGEQTEFALVFLSSGEPTIQTVKAGAVTRDVSTFWLGDHTAFAAFQEHFATASGDRLSQRMRAAFESIIEDEALGTVGGFAVHTYVDRNICPGEAVFSHCEHAKIEVTHPQTIPIIRKNTPAPVPLGTVEGGAYGVTYLRTVSPRFHGLAVHFPHARFGVLLCPQISLDIVVLEEVDGLEFVNRVADKLGVPLAGFVMVPPSRLQRVDTRSRTP